MVKRVSGVVMLLMAAALLGWVGYNVFIKTTEAARGLSPIPALLFSAGLIYVGQKWARGQKEE
ncbi:MAG: hypothetical protein ACYTFI_20575 [Planctomycetota bacterium]|jgi:TRAP-type C4-dicarboxylate transport system permease small subunit